MTRLSRSMGGNAGHTQYAKGSSVKLKCGCEVSGSPITVFPGGRRVFRCPQHGLQDSKR